MNKKRSITIKVVLLLAVVCLAGFFTACAKKRTVVFDSCGGTAVETVTVKNKGTVQKPADPTREGYTFEYWTLDGEKFDFSTKITKDITLVAVWKEISVEPVKKVATPTNVVINGNVVSWNAVEGATGYIVYVDGVAKEVTTTSYTLENTDKIEVLICVAAKDAKSVSELSTSVVYRNEIDEAKVQEVIEKFNLPATGYEESVKELAYALAKYNVTPEELLALANGSENPLENILAILQADNAKELLEISAIYGCILGQIALDQQVGTKPELSESSATMLEELYRKLIEEKLYTPSTMYEKYSDDKYFVEQLAPYILKSTKTNSYYFELSSVIDKICENAKCSVYRNGDEIVVEISKEEKLTIKISDIAAYGNYFYQGKNNSDSSAKFEAYTAALDELYSCVINQNEQYEALSKALKEQLRDVRACISVNGQTIVDVVNQVLSVQVALAPIIEAFGNLGDEMNQAMADLSLLPAFLEKVVGLKNQAIDIISSVLPTKEQCEAIDSILEQLANLLAPIVGDSVSKDISKLGSYSVVESLNKVLAFLKSIDTKNYDIEAVIKAYLLGSSLDMDKANAELAKLVNNLIAALKDVITSYEISAEELSLMFESLSEVLPTINEIQVALGIKLNEEEINKFITIIGRFITYIDAKKVTAEDVSTIVRFIMSSISEKPGDKEIIALVMEILLPKVIDYIDTDLVDELAPYIKSYFEYLYLTSGEKIDGDKLVSALRNNIEGFKELILVASNASKYSDVEDLEALLDMWIEVANDTAKLNRITKAIKELNDVLDPDSEMDLYLQLVDENRVANLTAAKQLIGKHNYEFTEEDRAILSKINCIISWEYPENDITEVASISIVKEEDKIIVTILPGLTDVQFLSTYAYLDVYLVEGGYKSKYLGEVTYDQDGKVAIITIRASDLQQISELNYTKCVLQLNTIDVKGVGYSFETEIDLTEMASYTK